MKRELIMVGLLWAASISAAPESADALNVVWNSPTSSVAERAAALTVFVKTNETTYAELTNLVGVPRVYSRAYGVEDPFSPPGGYTLLYEADYRFTDGVIWVRFIADLKRPKSEWRFHHLQVTTNRTEHDVNMEIK